MCLYEAHNMQFLVLQTELEQLEKERIELEAVKVEMEGNSS